MGTEKLELIINQIKGGRINDRTLVAIIQNATLKNQAVITGNLGNIACLAKEHDVKPPAIVIIGDIVNLNKKIKWYMQETGSKS
jgi:siroheme synthase